MGPLADLLETLTVAIYMTDSQGRLTSYNSAAASLWKFRPALGSHWFSLWTLYWPDGRRMSHDESPVAAVLKGQTVRAIETIAERSDGSRVPLIAYPTGLKDSDGNITGAVNVLVETSDRQQTDNGAVSAWLSAIVMSSDDAIVGKTLDGRITSWNAGATRIFGYEPAEAIGRSITIIIPPELRGEAEEVLARLRRGEHIEHFDTVRVAKDGRLVNISLTVSPVRDASGTIIGASKIARDITERKENEELQRLLFDELSHRVKNTLAAIQSIATQSLEAASTPQQFVTSFNGRIRALARAHDLLVERKMTGACVMEIVREQVLIGTADDERIVCSGPPVMVDAAVATQLALVLHELATNARKYGALSGMGGKLSVSWKVSSCDSEIELHWRESRVQNVVAPISRGFGTKLIERTLRSCGGEAVMRYDPGGLTCELRLPLQGRVRRSYGAIQSRNAAFHRATENQIGPPSATHAEPSLRGKRVLIVEDEPLIAMEIESGLERVGCEVLGPAGTIELAKRLLAGGRVDAALLDANLNGRPVDELAAALVRNNIPFAFATGYGRDSLPAAFRDAVLLAKPFSADRLIAVVQDLLRQQMPRPVWSR